MVDDRRLKQVIHVRDMLHREEDELRDFSGDVFRWHLREQKGDMPIQCNVSYLKEVRDLVLVLLQCALRLDAAREVRVVRIDHHTRLTNEQDGSRSHRFLLVGVLTHD